MNKTTNYNLNQWENTDPVRREDFNADNVAVDNALATLSSAVSALSSGSVKMACGTYVGNGQHQKANAITLNFDFQPQLVIIQRTEVTTTYAVGSYAHTLTQIYVRPLERFNTCDGNDFAFVNWGDKSVSWYSASNAQSMLNTQGMAFHYIALGA